MQLNTKEYINSVLALLFKKYSWGSLLSTATEEALNVKTQVLKCTISTFSKILCWTKNFFPIFTF